MKIVSVVGARPQFIKAAALSRVLSARHQEVLVHTGQHYDPLLSDVFFSELDLPPPDYHLGVGSATHGKQTAQILERLERVLLKERPQRVLVYGDTNSTLAGALAAAKLNIPLAHVEAGLRSGDRTMPEELNRILADHCADLLFCPTQTAVDNLAREGITAGVHLVGDVMYDALLAQLERLDPRAKLERLALTPRGYVLVTVHRAANTDDPRRLRAILDALGALALPAVFPAHPRVLKAMAAARLSPPPNVRVIDPVGYGDMLALEKEAHRVLTDSGGMQKEAFLLGVPCVTLRDETEWPETVACGWNTLAGADAERIAAAVERPPPTGDRPPLFGDGHAAEKIVRVLKG
ncbi:MAG: UDP-N-acetylglucosamine 2-epimerase (non-hydrolyzing) [Dehalococcoidia bacterium]|nr:UDP-N-acetylglucosamine 2-epimerase (non-hydrolyzing) [Dehalococcoidia bacterium]